jgi:predicted TIM-barrel fold metal-dependent hydrolase
MSDKEKSYPLKDCHVLVTTEELLALKEQLFSRGNKRLREISRQRRMAALAQDSPSSANTDAATIAKLWLAELDNVGVDEAILLCEVPTARDFVFSVTQFAKERLWAFTNLDPLQTWSAEDLKRDVARGFVGLNLLPTLQHFHVYDRRAYGLYEMCEQLRVPVMVHFGMTDEIFADMRFANPLDLQPVARDFPEVPFIVPSLGSGFLRELLMLMGHCPNVYADSAGIHLWLNYQPERLDLEDVVKLLLDAAGPHRILFGSGSGEDHLHESTDYRREILLLQTKLFSTLSDDEQEHIFGRTLTKLISSIDKEKACEKRKGRLKLRTLKAVD